MCRAFGVHFFGPPCISPQTPGNSTAVWRSFDATFYIGWTSLIASRSDCVSTFFCAYTAWRHRTCLNCAGPFRSVKDVICGHRTAVNSSYLVIQSSNHIGRRSFGYAGPKAWNSLPDYLRCSDLSLETFKRQLRRFCSHTTSAFGTLEVFVNDNAVWFCPSLPRSYIVLWCGFKACRRVHHRAELRWEGWGEAWRAWCWCLWCSSPYQSFNITTVYQHSTYLHSTVQLQLLTGSSAIA